MAISNPVLVQNWYDRLNGNNQTTNQTNDADTQGNATVQLVSGRRYYAAVINHGTGQDLTTLRFDSGGADQVDFAQITNADVLWDGGIKRIEIWELNCTSTTAASFFTLTFNASVSSQQMFLFYIDGEDDSGTTVQVKTATGTSTTPAVTFDAFSATDNLMLFIASTSNFGQTFTPTEGRSELVDDDDTERFTSCVHYQNPHGSDTTVDATTANDTWGAIGLEIKAAAGGGGGGEAPASFIHTQFVNIGLDW